MLDAVLAQILDADGRLLIVKSGRAEGWAVPGGYCLPRENKTSAVARHIKNETGLAVTSMRELGTMPGAHSKQKCGAADVITVFAVTVTGEINVPHGSEVCWADRSSQEGLARTDVPAAPTCAISDVSAVP